MIIDKEFFSGFAFGAAIALLVAWRLYALVAVIRRPATPVPQETSTAVSVTSCPDDNTLPLAGGANLGIIGPLDSVNCDTVGQCKACGQHVGIGSRLCLARDDGPASNVETPPVFYVGGKMIQARAGVYCGTCALYGRRVLTPSGYRVVVRVKSGDGSPYPVDTVDPVTGIRQQWKTEELRQGWKD